MQWLEAIDHIFNALAGLSTPILGAFTYLLLRRTTDLQERSVELARQSKQADVVVHCNTRFDALLRIKHEKLDTAQTFYIRFWSLQMDQFGAWEDDLLPDKIYARWLRQRRIDWQNENSYEGMSFQSGWEFVWSEWRAENYKDFKAFFERVMKHGNVEQVMREARERRAVQRRVDA